LTIRNERFEIARVEGARGKALACTWLVVAAVACSRGNGAGETPDGGVGGAGGSGAAGAGGGPAGAGGGGPAGAGGGSAGAGGGSAGAGGGAADAGATAGSGGGGVAAGGSGGGTAACIGHDVDVPSVTIAGAIRIGGAMVTNPSDYGILYLINAASDFITLGRSSDGTYAVRGIPGTYDLLYVSGMSVTAPANMDALLRAGVVVAASGTTTLDVDVPVATVAGAMKIAGATVTSLGDAGRLFLSNSAGDQIPLGPTYNATYSVRAIPGTYDVVYVNATGTSVTAPLNARAVVATGIVVAASATTPLDVDVPSVTVTGAMTIAGATVADGGDAAQLFLRNAARDQVPLGNTSSATYSTRVVPGTYDLYYGIVELKTLPGNFNARLATGVVVAATGTTRLDVDVPAVTVTGAMTIAGQTVTSSPDFGTLSLRNAAGDEVRLGQTFLGTYSVRAIPGTYDLYYEHGSTGSGTAPRNFRARLRSGVIVAATGTTHLDVDVPAVTVAGAMTIAGQTVTSPSDSGTLCLRDGVGDEIELGQTSDASYSVRAVPGTYDLYYQYVTNGSTASATGTAPQNQSRRIATGVVVAATGTTRLDVDVPSATVTGAMTIAGMTVTNPADFGYLYLHDPAGGIELLGQTLDATYAVRVIPGPYDLYYQRGLSVTAPVNESSRLGCYVVP
jgi:hypothetical protein